MSNFPAAIRFIIRRKTGESCVSIIIFNHIPFNYLVYLSYLADQKGIQPKRFNRRTGWKNFSL
jgi:hypothetical protein